MSVPAINGNVILSDEDSANDLFLAISNVLSAWVDKNITINSFTDRGSPVLYCVSIIARNNDSSIRDAAGISIKNAIASSTDIVSYSLAKHDCNDLTNEPCINSETI